MTHILGVVASLRETSHTRKLIEYILSAAQEMGAETRLIDLRLTPLPMYDPHEVEDAEHYGFITESLLWADAIVLGSPDYHGSMSGVMKNFLDYYWREFTGRLFGYVVASHEKGLTVQDQMRTAIRQCYGWSLPYGIGFNGDQSFDESEVLTDTRLMARARMFARDLVVYGGLLRHQFEEDLADRPLESGFARMTKK